MKTLTRLRPYASRAGAEMRTRAFWWAAARSIAAVFAFGSLSLLLMSQVPDVVEMVQASPRDPAVLNWLGRVLAVGSPVAIVWAALAIFVPRPCSCECSVQRLGEGEA